MPIVNKNQVIDSHLASTVEKIASKVSLLFLIFFYGIFLFLMPIPYTFVHILNLQESCILQRGPVDEVVEDVVRRLVDAVCCDIPSTSKYSALTLPKDPDSVIESLHYEMVTKAAKLMGKVDHIKCFGVLYIYMYIYTFFGFISKLCIFVTY